MTQTTDHKELYLKLKEAYSDQNLNRITAGIIDLYKSGEYHKIKEITRIVSDYIDISDEKVHKCFSRLIMIYHPDKANHYRQEIDRIMQLKTPERLAEYTHILAIQDLEKVILTINPYEDIDYEPHYVNDMESDGYDYFSDDDPYRMIYDDEDYSDYEYNSYHDPGFDKSFYSAVKRKLYGTLDIDLPPYYLEDIEEIEMSECQIDNLDGIEYCKQVINLDLSNNEISDISGIVNLIYLEELYLQGNQIGLVDVLYNLRNLRIIDLADNNIDDISPLFGLNKLEYLNILGNHVPQHQIDILKHNDVMVIAS